MTTSGSYHPSWSETARSAFESIVAAHGGWPAWHALETVDVRLRAFGGLLVRAKGLHRTFQAPDRIVANVKLRRVDFVFVTHTDRFEEGALTISPARAAFAHGRSLFRRTTFEQWRPEHAAYFFGSAWANYLSYPFLLAAQELVQVVVSARKTTLWVRFPPHFHTHCPVQRFVFDQHGLLHRHDYRAELAGPLVYGAHFTSDYFEYRGVKLAGRRVVKARVGAFATPLIGIYGEIAPST